MKLYSTPQTRSDRPRWVLEELGLDYEIVSINLRAGEQRTPEFRKLNPLGQVPVLVDGDHIVTESGAICLYLADKVGKLAPPIDQRADYYRWCFYAYSGVEPSLVEFFLNTRRLEEDERSAPRAAEAQATLRTRLQVLDDTLKGRDFIVGSEFTVADVLIGSVLDWADSLGEVRDFPGLQAYLAGLRARPAFARSKG